MSYSMIATGCDWPLWGQLLFWTLGMLAMFGLGRVYEWMTVRDCSAGEA